MTANNDVQTESRPHWVAGHMHVVPSPASLYGLTITICCSRTLLKELKWKSWHSRNSPSGLDKSLRL